MSRRFRIMLAGAFALLAVVLCLAYGEEVRAEEQKSRQESLERYGGEVVSVLVASSTLEAGETISSSNAELRDWVSDLVPEGAITSLGDAQGRQLTEPVSAGEPICQIDFRDAESSVEIPSGMVAFSLSITGELGVPGGVAAGDKLVAYKVSDGSVELLSSDVVVLSMPSQAQSLSSSQSMSIAVLPGDLPRILTSSTEGSLRLAAPAEGLTLDDSGFASAPTSVGATDEEGTTNDGSADNGAAANGSAES